MKGVEIILKWKLIIITMIIFITLILLSCDTYKMNSEIVELHKKIEVLNKEKQSYIEEIENVKDALKEKEFMRNLRYRETMEYREEISRLLKLLDSGGLGAIEFPVYKGFDSTVNKQHINIIDLYLTNFKDGKVNDPIYASADGVEPIFYYLTIEPTEPMFLPKKEDVHYYEVVLYWSLIPSIGIERDPFLTRGPFDGLSWFIMQIKNIDNEWQVIDFGQDT